MNENEQLLKDYVATWDKYQDWDTVNSKFPEFESVDPQILKDYVATWEKYQNWDQVNERFPEFFPEKKRMEHPNRTSLHLLERELNLEP